MQFFELSYAFGLEMQGYVSHFSSSLFVDWIFICSFLWRKHGRFCFVFFIDVFDISLFQIH